MGTEPKRYNTQELLSMNMDRLKKYMKDQRQKTGKGSQETLLQLPKRPQRKTQVTKIPESCRLLCLFENPLHFARLVTENDMRAPGLRFNLEWTANFQDTVSRMTGVQYDILIITTLSAWIKDVEISLTSFDWILLVRGLLLTSDMYFVAKKRWFAANLMQGSSNKEKVDNFRRIRETYKNTPILYLYNEEDTSEKDMKILSKAPAVRILQLQGSTYELLFKTLDELTLTC